MEKHAPPEAHDALFELIGYPVEAAAAMNVKCLALTEFFTGQGQDRSGRLTQAQQAQNEIDRLTDVYNHQIAGGKWRYMMSADPRGQLDLKIPQLAAVVGILPGGTGEADTGLVKDSEDSSSSSDIPLATAAGADFVEANHCIIMAAAHASALVPGKDAQWRKIIGLGYNDEAVSVFPTLVTVRDEPRKILSESPCLEYKLWFQHPGDWKFTVRALPTFSAETGKPQRYAVAVDDEPPQIVSLPASLSESNRRWQENVLRNAALTTSSHTIASTGVHTLKLWMVDPGIVIDAIAAQTGSEQSLGYTWPAETRLPHQNQ
jgi:hypothetical protein